MTRRRGAPSNDGRGPASIRTRRGARSGAVRKAPTRSRPDTPGLASHAIRVVCVDDHAMLVEGLKAQFAIDGGIEVVGRLATASRLLEEVERLRPHVALMDIEMPGPDAFEMTDRLRRAHPEVRVVILSAHIRDGFISASFKAGASAYFAKSDDLEDIVNGVHEVVRNGPSTFVLGPRVRERCRALPNDAPAGPAHGRDDDDDMDGGAHRAEPTTRLSSLTSRESEILRLIGKGLSRAQIASQLCRSAKTIDGHQTRMMKKLSIASRADLMRFAIREGLALA